MIHHQIIYNRYLSLLKLRILIFRFLPYCCITELAAEIYNEVKKQNTLERLQVQEIAEIYENACVSTCSLVLAILYLEKVKSTNPKYVEKVAPSELFLVSLVYNFLVCNCLSHSKARIT